MCASEDKDFFDFIRVIRAVAAIEVDAGTLLDELGLDSLQVLELSIMLEECGLPCDVLDSAECFGLDLRRLYCHMISNHRNAT